MDKRTINRLENNHYAIEKAYQRLKKAIDIYHDKEIYAATGEMLFLGNDHE